MSKDEILRCPHCNISILDGTFNEEVTYVVSIGAMNNGKKYIRENVDYPLDDTTKNIHCTNCGQTFEKFKNEKEE